MTSEYDNLISKLNFIEREVFKKDVDSKTFLVSGTIDDQLVMLKAFSKENTRRRKGIEKEIVVDKIIEKANQERKDQFLKTSILDSGESESLVWLTRKYFVGNSLTIVPAPTKYKITPDKLSAIRPEYLTKKDQVLSEIINQIKIFQKIDNQDIDKFQQGYARKLNKYNTNEIAKGLGVDLSQQLYFYEENFDEYVSNINYRPCLGDLTPANVLITQQYKVILSDLEWLCLDNQTLDIAFLWLFLHRYPDWQNKLVSGLITNKITEINFRSSIIRLLIANLNNIFGKNRSDLQNIDEIKELYKNHIWTKYLVAAGESYDKLINVRDKDE